MSDNDLIRRSDAENIFRSARRAMKPENYSGQEFFIRDNILLNAEQIVHALPAVDAVEVVRAYWTRKRTGEHDGELYCSACEKEALLIDWREEWKSQFCPWCGARMDRRREEEHNAKAD